MKKTLLIIGVILAAGFLFFSNWVSGASSQVKQSWEIELPKGGTEVYCINGEPNAAYYAFIYDTAEKAEEAFEWQLAEGATNEYATYAEAIDAWMVEAGVPDTLPIEIPEGPYYYKSKEDGSELIIVLDGRMLHMIESIKE